MTAKLVPGKFLDYITRNKDKTSKEVLNAFLYIFGKMLVDNKTDVDLKKNTLYEDMHCRSYKECYSKLMEYWSLITGDSIEEKSCGRYIFSFGLLSICLKEEKEYFKVEVIMSQKDLFKDISKNIMKI